MSNDYQEMKKKLEEDFAKLDEERKSLIEQRRQLDQRLSQIQTEQLRLQGSYKTVTELESKGSKSEK